MELHQLKYFEEVARAESISKAASELHITQPALSKSIAKLEDELGVELFDRRGKRLYLNDQGRYFQSSVKRILADVDDSASALRRLAAGEEGSIRIAVFGPQRDALACTTTFMVDNPGARVSFEARQSQASRHLVREFDVIFYPANDAFDGIVGVPYRSSSLKLAVPEGHPLALKSAGSVALNELAEESFVFMNTTNGVYERSYRLCMDNGFYPHVRAITSSGAAQVDFIRAGLGVGFVDDLMGSSPIPGLVLIDVDSKVPDQMLFFSCRPTSQLSPLAVRFLQHTFDFFGIPADARSFDQFDGN